MKAIRAAAFLLPVAALVTAPRVAGARMVEKIAAVVGENVVLASEVEEKAAPLMADVSRVTDPDKRAARASALLREALKQQGMSMASYRADLKRQLLRFRVINIAVGSRVNVSDDEVKAYYERHMKGSANVQVRASHIFIAIPDGADVAAAAEKEAQAKKILERAKTEDFAKLAREVSDDTATRADGGDLGYFGKDMLPKPIEELVFAMKVGEVRGPVRADRGFHVIKLVDRKVKDAKPLDDVKDDIRMQLRQKDMERQTKIYLTELRKKTLVDIRY